MFILVSALALSLIVAAPEPSRGSSADVDYSRDVKPVLKNRCFACHGALKQESGLRLDTGASIRAGGEGGAAVVPGAVPDSPLIDRITSHDESDRMPPEGEPLTAQQIDRIKAWILQGAPAPDNEQPEEDPRAHWAFTKPVRPTPPLVRNAAWIGNPIDAFIAFEQEKRGLTPLPPAEKQILLRRVHLDLIGLPPTRAQLHAFLSDDSRNAYERVVDRLLASPQYGERWGRHWMDVWRYSDWYGRRQVGDVRNSYPHIWRWRDWIIESLNSDKGYDQMVREMLAADELYPEDDSRIVALGFIVRNWYSLNYESWKQDLVEHTGKAFLGLRLNCAHCHDHKYDPITQEEYFRFRAFFEPLELRHDRVPGGPALTKLMRYKPGSSGSLKPIEAGLARVYDHYFDEKTYLYRLGDPRDRVDDSAVEPAPPAILGANGFAIEPVELPASAWYPGLKPFAQQAEIEQRVAALETAEAALATARATPQPVSEQSAPAERESVDQAVTDPVGTEAESKKSIDASSGMIAVGEARLAQAQAGLVALRARIAADTARYGKAPGAADELSKQAADAERRSKLAAARVKLATNRQILDSQNGAGDAKKIKQAETDAAAARKTIADLEKNTGDPRDAYTPLGPQYPKRSTGRRRALANWIASRDNPLTARVAINHLWLRHFGRPLVDSVTDFGRAGKRPTHPALLDWLAVELMEPRGATGQDARHRPESGPAADSRPWSMKRLHRLIVTSNAYRRSSQPTDGAEANLRIDKDNAYLWRFDRRRLEAEIVRDGMLAVSGELDTTIGGPVIDPKEEASSRRRSLYFTVYPEAGGMMRFLTLFDPPDPGDCYRRSESIVPQQALALANSPLALEQGRRVVRRLSREITSATPIGEAAKDDRFITAAFERVLSRAPTSEERRASRLFLDEQRELYAKAGADLPKAAPKQGVVVAASDPGQRARESLVRVLVNHNDFVTIH